MRPYSEAQKRASYKYRSKFKTLNLRFTADEYEMIKQEAKERGQSIQGYVKSIVKRRGDIQTPAAGGTGS